MSYDVLISDRRRMKEVQLVPESYGTRKRIRGHMESAGH